MNSLNPHIYVVCLAAYNHGHLCGAWINAAQSAENLQSEINALLAKSPIPDEKEWVVNDYKNFFNVSIDKYETLQKISEIAMYLEEYGKLGSALLAYSGNDLEWSKEAMEDYYIGEYESEEDFTRSFAEDTLDIPENIAYYIDYQRMAQDYFINSFISFELGYQQVHVFHAH